MAKKTNVYKFEIIERVINEVSCENKEDAVALAKKMKEVALRNDDYSQEVKDAFSDACNEIENELTLANLQEIKKVINGNKQF